MKKILTILLLFISVIAFSQEGVPARPNPPKLVNDYTNTLTAVQVKALEDKLVAEDDSTTTQIAVVIINSTQGRSIDDQALDILRAWGIGGKENNNGVILLIAMADRKMAISTGYGMEGRVTDLFAASIIDNELRPNFRDNNYYRGIDEATDAIIKAAAGAYKAPAGYSKKKKGIGIGSLFFLFVLFLIFLGIFGGRGGRNGGMMSGTGWLIGSLLGSRGWSGGGSGWSGGGGGGWSGGGGGGFGGFGGGGGGGGGASGGW